MLHRGTRIREPSKRQNAAIDGLTEFGTETSALAVEISGGVSDVTQRFGLEPDRRDHPWASSSSSSRWAVS